MTYQPAIPFESMTYKHYVISTMSRPQPVRGVTTQTPLSNAWPLANLALYVPIYVQEECTFYEVGTGAGGTAGGNLDLGLYDMAGTRLQSTGTQSRTLSAWNNFNWTDLVVAPGWYYAAMAADSTALYGAIVPAAGLAEAAGVCEQTSAFVLPATATLTRTTRAYIPNVAFSIRSLGF